MLKQATIQNYQSHKATTLEFHPGINVLVGTSDCGKSGVLRAINWAVNNNPGGTGFMSHWARGEDPTQVELQFNDTTVIRTKGGAKGVNEYIVDDCELGTIGTGVPDNVSQKLDIGDMSISFQHDAPFLLTMSPGEVGKYLNAIVKLDSIDTIQAAIEADRRATNKQIKETTTSLETQKKKLESLGWVEEATSLLEIAKTLNEEYDSGENLLNSIAELSDKYELLLTRTIDPAIVARASNLLELADKLFTERKDVELECSRVESLTAQYERLESSQVDEAIIAKGERIIPQITVLRMELTTVDDDIAQISRYASRMEVQMEREQELVLKLEKAQQDYEQACSVFCPTCGRTMGGDHDIHG